MFCSGFSVMNSRHIDFTDTDLHARFWSKVHITTNVDECWEWQACTSKGYGQFFIGRVKWRAHRLAWLFTHRNPIQHNILHSCDTPRCCNPRHLRDGTQLENVQECVSKGRRVVVFRPKLTAVDVQNIRVAAESVSRTALAQRYGVNTSTIGQILRKEIWRNIV